MQRSHRAESILRNVVLILLFSVALSFTYNTFSPTGLPMVRVPAQKTGASDSSLFAVATLPTQRVAIDTVVDTATHQKVPVFAPLQQKARANRDSVKKAIAASSAAKKDTSKYTVVTLDQLSRLLKAKHGILIDARNEEDYVKAHIPGAHNIPFMDMDKYFDQIAQIPQDTLIIVYCNGVECHLGRGLCDFLVQMEFHHVVLYDEGWDGWQAAKMPEETLPPKN